MQDPLSRTTNRLGLILEAAHNRTVQKAPWVREPTMTLTVAGPHLALAAAPSAGATSLSVTTPVDVGAQLSLIDANSSGEIVTVTAVTPTTPNTSGLMLPLNDTSQGPWTLTLSAALLHSYLIGATIWIVSEGISGKRPGDVAGNRGDHGTLLPYGVPIPGMFGGPADNDTLVALNRPGSAAILGRVMAYADMAVTGALGTGMGTTATLTVDPRSSFRTGTLSLTANGTGLAAGKAVTITYAGAGATGQRIVVVCPANAGASAMAHYVQLPNIATTFELWFNSAPVAGTTYSFNWMAL